MIYDDILARAEAAGAAGLLYQVPRTLPFRDRVTFYRDGKILFERYCYGESAGLIFTMWGSGTPGSDDIAWDYDACANSKKTEAPKQLCGQNGTDIFFDGKLKTPWTLTETVKSSTGGVGFLKKLFRKK